MGLFASQMFSLMTTGKLQVKEYNYDLDAFLEYMSSLKLRDEPGTTFRYSNVGFGLAGKILERITDKTYDELVRIYICNELGMRDTGINILESHKDRLATGYSFKNKQTGYWNVSAIESAGSLRSTTEDMAKFLEAALGLKETSWSVGICKMPTDQDESKNSIHNEVLYKILWHIAVHIQVGMVCLPTEEHGYLGT